MFSGLESSILELSCQARSPFFGSMEGRESSTLLHFVMTLMVKRNNRVVLSLCHSSPFCRVFSSRRRHKS